jgi:hypothetical protein
MNRFFDKLRKQTPIDFYKNRPVYNDFYKDAPYTESVPWNFLTRTARHVSWSPESWRRRRANLLEISFGAVRGVR